jgi:hypothetical protein
LRNSAHSKTLADKIESSHRHNHGLTGYSNPDATRRFAEIHKTKLQGDSGD